MESGTRLGPYEITAPIGRGGMGEVYKARDTRLDRQVAVKILPKELALDAGRRLRFEREARTISSLSHPNICALFDVGREGDVDYLVMEYLEGESLADRLGRGPVPIDQVLRIGVEIAAALDRAHREGIVHRDLKPGNVMLTRSGAKLLDFGLARVTAESAASVATSLPTEAKPLTAEGTIVGTFQYMAPEQLEGLEADARTDIFAFGCVLYEMVTGRRAFDGKSRTSLIAAIVQSQPQPVSEIQPLTPPALEHVIRKCLEKDPDSRWQSAHDLASELKWISDVGSMAGVAAPLTRRKKRSERLWWGAALVATAAVAAFFALRPAPVPPRVQTSIVPPDGVAISFLARSMALSRDGRQLAFLGHGADGRMMLWVRSIATGAARPIPKTENADAPFWSPDGRYIGFIADRKLKKVALAGGSPEIIADVPAFFFGGAWNSDGQILYSTGPAILLVPAAGGVPKTVIAPRGLATVGAHAFSSPLFLPDGQHFLYTSIGAVAGPPGVFVSALDGKEQKLLLTGVYSNTVYVDPGILIYAAEGDLRAQRFDVGKFKPVGEPVRLADDVRYDADAKAAVFSASETGDLIFAAGEAAGRTQMVWVGRDGKDLGAVAPPAMFYTPRLSHDGTRIAVDLSDPALAKGDIWIFDLVRGSSSRLSYDPANESMPVWSPDDRLVYFFSEKLGRLDIFARAANGSGQDRPLLTGGAAVKLPFDISSDGHWLAWGEIEANKRDVNLLDLTTGKSSPLLATPFTEWGAEFSPDGKWITFASDESGQNEVYVQAFPESAGKIVISRGGGGMPQWRADGREIYYLSPDRTLMAVPITYTPDLNSGVPVPLFRAIIRRVPFRQFAATRDGSRFLLNRTVGEEGREPLTFVQNWKNALGK